MKKWILFSFAIFSFLPQIPFAQSSYVPFTLELTEITNSDWPGLHSFAFAEWNDLWIFVGGRTNGLHGFFLATGFPVASANEEIWIMDVQTGDSWSYDLNLLPDHLTEALRSTNPQFSQNDNTLYVIGGYGKSLATDDFVTFPTLTAIQLDILVPAILNGNDPASAFQQITDSRLQVCGGEMLALGDSYYLVGGHHFSGRYEQGNNPAFTQVYTNEIRKFDISQQNGTLSIANYTAFENTEQYHRRDLNIAPLILPNQSPALAAYGGVFQQDADLPFEHPIYISENGIEVDENFSQKMSHYTCPIIPLFDATSSRMHSIFFAGLSWHFYDHENEVFVKDDLVPFINDITVLTKDANGVSTETVLPIQFDELLGTNAKFMLHPDVPHYDNKVIKLEEISERTLVGYIFGGIKAQFMNITPSSASHRLFEVYLTPDAPLSISETVADNFSVDCKNGKPELTWLADNWSSMDYFEIEYAIDAPEKWQLWKKVNASSSATPEVIPGFDKSTQTVYYRLKMVQNDHSIIYSNIVSSSCHSNYSWSVFPNPALNIIHLDLPVDVDIQQISAVEMTDIYGRMVLKDFQIKNNHISLDIAHLPSGMYGIKVYYAKNRIGFGKFLVN